MTKDTATAAIREMPQEFDVDELIERLLFIEKVKEGLKQIDNSQKIPLVEVKKIFSPRFSTGDSTISGY